MTRKNYRPYLILIAFLLGLLSLPLGFSEGMRGATIALLTRVGHTPHQQEPELQKLRLANYQLTQTIQRLREMVLATHSAHKANEDALLARVIFRSPASWSSSCWLNVGEEDNKQLSKTVVAINSPVVVGNSVVGVVDYVGKKQCRVRLITDAGLSPSVRAVRGDLQKMHLRESIAELREKMQLYGYLVDQEQLKQALAGLDLIHKSLQDGKGSWHLAKGEIQGASQPMWRSLGSTLKGTGFNYDFPDRYGPARDLRTGIPYGEQNKPRLALLKERDLLVTTGMDGVFPEGLKVAQVSKVEPLKEGDYYYEIEAYPTAGNLQELAWVHVLPPISYDPNDQPPLYR